MPTPGFGAKAPFFSKKSNVVKIAIVYTFLWGLAFPLIKICMESFEVGDDEASKCLIAGLRFLISGSLILALCGKRARKNFVPCVCSYVKIGIYGLLSTTFQYAFTFIGLSHVSGAVGSVYDQSGVFLTVIAGGLLLKNDSLTWKKILGCLIGFAGIFVVSVDPDAVSGFLEFSVGGEGMMLCAAFCSAVAYLVAKLTAEKIPAEWLIGCGQLFGGVLLTGGSLLLGGRLPVISATGVLTLVALALISAVSYVLSLLPLKYFPASETAAFNLLITVFGTLLSALVLGENILSWKYPAALLLIGIGIYLINRKERKKAQAE